MRLHNHVDDLLEKVIVHFSIHCHNMNFVNYGFTNENFIGSHSIKEGKYLMNIIMRASKTGSCRLNNDKNICLNASDYYYSFLFCFQNNKKNHYYNDHGNNQK